MAIVCPICKTEGGKKERVIIIEEFLYCQWRKRCFPVIGC
jgi:uncharacterized protein YbaR (Trm112 family)